MSGGFSSLDRVASVRCPLSDATQLEGESKARDCSGHCKRLTNTWDIVTKRLRCFTKSAFVVIRSHVKCLDMFSQRG